MYLPNVVRPNTMVTYVDIIHAVYFTLNCNELYTETSWITLHFPQSIFHKLSYEMDGSKFSLQVFMFRETVQYMGRINCAA